MRSGLGLGGLMMEKSKERVGEGGLVMVIARCTEKEEPSMMSKSSSSLSSPGRKLEGYDAVVNDLGEWTKRLL